MKPRCQRCIDLGVRCNGYRGIGDVEFRDQTRNYARVAQSARSQNTRTSSEPTPGRNMTNRLSRPTRSFSIPLVSPIEIDPSLETSLSLFGVFLQQYLPSNSGVHSITGFTYLSLLPELPSKGPALTATMSTVAAVGLEITKADGGLLNQARKFYSDALKRVSMALVSPGSDEQAERTLAAAQLLRICEVLTATISVQGGCMAHEEGVCSIFETRSAVPVASKLGQFLFYSNRFHLTYIAIGTRRAVSYDQFSWLQRTKLHSGDAFVSLTDVLVQIPRVLEQVDQAFSTIDMQEKRHKSEAILRVSFSLQKQLRQWYQVFAHRHSGKLHALVATECIPTFSAMGLSDALTGAFQFSSFRSALLLTSYWNGIDTLSWTMMDLLGEAYSPRHPHFQLENNGLKQEGIQCATYICQSMPFILEQDNCGLFGRLYAPWPLRFARQFSVILGAQSQVVFCGELERWLLTNGICVPWDLPSETWSPGLDISPVHLAGNAF